MLKTHWNYHLITSEAPFSKWAAVHQTGPMKGHLASYHLLPRSLIFTKSVTVSVSVAVSKMWVVLCQALSESQWTVEMLKSNFLDNRLPKRKNRFLFDYRFSYCTIPPHCDSHLNAASFDPVWMHREIDLPPSPRVHFSTLHRPPLFSSAGTFRGAVLIDRRDGLI